MKFHLRLVLFINKSGNTYFYSKRKCIKDKIHEVSDNKVVVLGFCNSRLDASIINKNIPREKALRREIRKTKDTFEATSVIGQIADYQDYMTLFIRGKTFTSQIPLPSDLSMTRYGKTHKDLFEQGFVLFEVISFIRVGRAHRTIKPLILI